MRTFCSSAMAALVIAALFWGNCFSCPQVLLSLKAQHGTHDCCKRGQKTTGSKVCNSQGLQNFVKSDAASFAPAPAVIDAGGALQTAAAWTDVPAPHARIVMDSPPDLLSLHSSFRI